MILPIALPLLIFFLIKHYTNLKFENVLIYTNVLKMTSIFYLAFHTGVSAAWIPASSNIVRGSENFYRYTSAFMVVITIILTLHTVTLMVPYPSSFVCGDADFASFLDSVSRFVHGKLCFHLVEVIAFLYMPAFLIGNYDFMRKNPDNIGVERFSKAFVFGVNAPSIFALVIIILTSLLVIDDSKKQEIFLSGSIALLVYSSTAASIYIDHYARPFLAASQTKCSSLAGIQSPEEEVP